MRIALHRIRRTSTRIPDTLDALDGPIRRPSTRPGGLIRPESSTWTSLLLLLQLLLTMPILLLLCPGLGLTSLSLDDVLPVLCSFPDPGKDRPDIVHVDLDRFRALLLGKTMLQQWPQLIGNGDEPAVCPTKEHAKKLGVSECQDRDSAGLHLLEIHIIPRKGSDEPAQVIPQLDVDVRDLPVDPSFVRLIYMVISQPGIMLTASSLHCRNDQSVKDCRSCLVVMSNLVTVDSTAERCKYHQQDPPLEPISQSSRGITGAYRHPWCLSRAHARLERYAVVLLAGMWLLLMA